MNFSVLMSVYRKENPLFLREALASIIDQSLRPNEIVLVKDGALTEDLEKVILDFQEKEPGLLKMIATGRNVGLGTALGIGVKKCIYEIIARMDSDDISEHRRFEKQMKFLKDHEEVDMVGSWIGEFEGDSGKILTTRKVPIVHDQILKFSKFRNPMNHMTIMAKKRSILEAGNYQHFSFYEDYYLWVRMIMHGARLANIPENLVLARINQDMFRRRKGIKYFLGDVDLQRKMLDMKFIAPGQFIKNIFLRGWPRLMPSSILRKIYKTAIR